MGKRTRQKRKERKTKKSIPKKTQSKKNYVNWAGGTALTIIPTIIGLRSSDMDPINVLLIGSGILWVWIAFKYSDFHVRKYRYFKLVWWIVFSIIIITSVTLACCARGKPKVTNQDLLAKLNEVLATIQKDESTRLKKEYPLGYVMIAFSGEKHIVDNYSDRFQFDQNVKIYKDNQNLLRIEMYNLFDKVNENQIGMISAGISLKPGTKQSIVRFPSFRVIGECLKNEPIGVYAVIGFSED